VENNSSDMRGRGLAKKVDIKTSSLITRILGPLFIIFLSINAFWWFFLSMFYLYNALLSEVIEFDKGALYSLGAGIGLLVLAIVAVQVGWFNRPLSKRQNMYFTRVALASIVLMLALPQIGHYFINNYMMKRGYSVCQAASHQWMNARTIIYIKPTIECKKGIADLFTYKPQVSLEDFRKK
jgi:hypothetical protein